MVGTRFFRVEWIDMWMYLSQSYSLFISCYVLVFINAVMEVEIMFFCEGKNER